MISQTETMSNNMEKLNDTISRQNFVIACIQQEFKQMMSDLYGKLGLAPPACADGSPVTFTAPQPAASSACQVGGAKAWSPIGLYVDLQGFPLAELRSPRLQ